MVTLDDSMNCKGAVEAFWGAGNILCTDLDIGNTGA